MSIAYQPSTGGGSPIVARNDPEYISYLERRIAVLESRLPRTGLLSASFMTRAFTVIGHHIVAVLVLDALALVAVGAVAIVIAVLSSAGR